MTTPAKYKAEIVPSTLEDQKLTIDMEVDRSWTVGDPLHPVAKATRSNQRVEIDYLNGTKVSLNWEQLYATRMIVDYAERYRDE